MCIKSRNSLYVYVLNGLCWGIKGMKVHCICQSFCMAVEGVKHFKKIIRMQIACAVGFNGVFGLNRCF